jgi:hypothetical protein
MEMEVTKHDAVILLNIWLFYSTNVVLLDKKCDWLGAPFKSEQTTRQGTQTPKLLLTSLLHNHMAIP